jgi:hypothetical protein
MAKKSKIRKNKKDMIKKYKDRNKSISGMLIPACLLIGIGIGLFTRQVAALTLIGLGVGFLLAFFYMRNQ